MIPADEAAREWLLDWVPHIVGRGIPSPAGRVSDSLAALLTARERDLLAQVGALRDALEQVRQSGLEVAEMAPSFIQARDVRSLTNYGGNIASLAAAALTSTADAARAWEAKLRSEEREAMREQLREEVVIWARWQTATVREVGNVVAEMGGLIEKVVSARSEPHA